MNKAQWEYIKVRLTILGCIAGLTLIILGMVYDWAVIYFALVLAFFAMVGYGISIIVATTIYRWRIMVITNDDEVDLLDQYWHYYIKDGHIPCKIHQIELGEVGKDWDDDYRQYVYGYLLKVALVKRPKILDI